MPALRMILLAVSVLCGFELCAFGQAPPYDPSFQTGTVPFQSYHGGDVDSVNLATGTLSVRIPLVSFPQRGGKLHLDYSIVYNTPVDGQTTDCPPRGTCTIRWIPVSNSPSGLGISSNGLASVEPAPNTNTGQNCAQVACTTSAPVVFQDLTAHQLGYLSTTSLRALDGSRYLVTPQSNGGQLVTDGAGVKYLCPPSSDTTTPCTATDLSGNQIVFGPNDTVDSVGRTIPPVSLPSGTWTVPGPNGGSAVYTVSEINPASSPQISGITLPNQTAYTFEYDSVALPFLGGESPMTALPVLSKIIFPTGASISYTYVAGKGGCGIGLGYPVITSRILDANDGQGPQTWTYQIGTGSSTVIDPLGNKTVHTFAQGACFPYETQTQQFDNNGNLLKTVNTNYSYVSWPDPNETPATNTPPYDVLPTNSTTVWPNGQQTRVSYTYDRDAGVGFNFGVALISTGGNPQLVLGTQPAGYTSRPWTVTEADYGQGAPGSVLRTTNTTFQWRVNSSFSAANMLTAPATVTTLNGAGSQAAQTTYSYDESQYVAAPGTYGLATTVSRWLNTGGTISTHTKYNGSGMPIQTIDANGNSTTYSYDGTGAFLSGVQYPATSGIPHNVAYTYDSNTGTITSETDENKQTTRYQYNDPLGRLTGTFYPDGGSTTYSYHDAVPISVTATVAASPDPDRVSTTVFDGLGRPIHQTGPDGFTVDTTYDGLGRMSTVSNPHGTSASSTDGTTTYTYDALGRWNLQTNPDKSTEQWNYTGSAVQFSDEGNSRTKVSRVLQKDALGRLISICEVSPNTQIGGGSPSSCGQQIAATGYLTAYTYDALGNLKQVTQGSRIRSFNYDSLSRLLTAANPETGTICYGTLNGSTCQNGYDANGNLLVKTDGNGFVTSYQYDALNRKTQESTTAPNTFTHSWAYDLASSNGATVTNPIGHLIFESTIFPQGTSTIVDGDRFYSKYDAMGRVLEMKECTPLNCANPSSGFDSWYDLQYSYDLAGNVHSYTDGFGTNITENYDAAGRPSIVTSSRVDRTHPGTLFDASSSTAYGPAGLLTAILGNNATVSHGYDNRMRMTASQITNVNGQLLYNLGLTFNPNSTINTGNDSVNGNWSYQYDEFNRLVTASSSAGLGCGFAYDQYGNRWQQVPLNGSCTSLIVTYNNSLNRIDGYCYDGAGQLLDQGGCVPSGGKNQNFYDGWGNLASGTFNSSLVSYTIDGEHRRVATFQGSLQHTYLYGADGMPIAETGGAGNWLQTDVYLNGSLLAEYSGNDTIFQHGDQVGTIRVQTNSAGSITASCTNQPFGDFLACNGAQNPSGYHFTGKQHDPETGNDYFGARFYASGMGRFLTPDYSDDDSPLPIPDRHLEDPQTLNLYSYVRNNPLRNSDPDGHACVINSTGSRTDDNNGGESCTQVDQANALHTPNVVVNAGQTMSSLLYAGAALALDFAPESAGQSILVAGGLIGTGLLIDYLHTQPIQFSNGDKNNAPLPPIDASNTGQGNREATPATTPDKFEPVRGTSAKKNIETGEVWQKDKFHGDHYEVYKNKNQFEKGQRTRAVWDDGRLKQTFK